MNSKQMSLIGAAVAAALGTTAANALAPSAWTNGTITKLVYSGGGSAEVQAVYSAAYHCLVASSIDVYSDAATNAVHPQSNNYLIISGTTNSNSGCGGAGTNVGFFYKYNGGSYPNGVQAQLLSAGSQTLAFPTTTQLAGATAFPGFAGTQDSVNPKWSFSSSPVLLGAVPDFGVGDEEYTLFQYAWNSSGSTGGLTNPLSAPAIHQPIYVAPFGIAVTANIYAQKTKWSSAEIQSVYQLSRNQGIVHWSDLVGDNGSPLTTPGYINLLDRSAGSGTRAAVYSYFFNYPAVTSAIAPYNVAVGFTTSCNNGTFSSGGICTSATSFQDIKEPSSVGIVDDLNYAQSVGLGAIGAIGLEFPPLYSQPTPGSNSYYFVAINGAFPDTETGTTDNINSPVAATTSYTNVVNGLYEFATQVSLNAHAAPTGFSAGVVSYLESENISAAYSGSAFPVSAEGVLLDPIVWGGDPGNISWSRQALTPNAPFYAGAQPAPNPVTIASQK
jgi:hypothetical protein